MKEIKEYNKTTFENIKHIDEYGNEYWKARELMNALEYSKWSNFISVIDKAKIACELSSKNIMEHFADVGKLSKRANNAVVEIKDYKLSRYACYLIVLNSDPRKEVVARYEDLPDIIVDINDKLGYVVDLKVYDYQNPSSNPILTTFGPFLNKCDPKVREDIIDRLVKLQQEEESVKDYKVIDEDMLEDVRNSLNNEMER